MYVSPISTSTAAGPLTPAGLYEQPLLAYVTNRLPAASWHCAADLARMAWASALGLIQPAAEAGMEEGIPAWLAAAARRVVREHTSPTRATETPCRAVPTVTVDRITVMGSGWTYSAARTATGKPAESPLDQVFLTVTARGHWYRSDDDRDSREDRVCRGLGCGRSGHFDYQLDRKACPAPATDTDIRQALSLPAEAVIPMPEAQPARPMERLAS